VYGLEEWEIAALRVRPGTARASLAQHARAVDGDRVVAIDRGAGVICESP
jgi:hypothetical protein